MTKDPIKEALQRIPYGFYSITSKNGDEVNAMVGNWLTQVSFEPRLLLFGLSKTAYSHELVAAGGVFAVNVFNKEDDAVIRQLTKARAKKPVSYTHLDVYKRQVVLSMQAAAAEAGVQIVAGDTKVVQRGKADGLYINTAGVGELPPGRAIGCLLYTSRCV